MTSTAKPVTPRNRLAAMLRSCVAADWGAALERTARTTAHPIAFALTMRSAISHYATSLLGRLSDLATRLGY